MANVNFPYRVTIVVPEAMIPDANQLALVLGEAPGDVNTFGEVWARDAGGTRYAIACTHGGPGFPADAQSQLTAPDHAPDADLEAATRAQAALVIGTPDNPEVPALDRITAMLGPNDRPDPLPDHMALMGMVFTLRPS